jgi:uncharacterized protein YndB with AHSA1/START domain
MEHKTKVFAEDGKQELVITRVFDLPLPLLFKAHAEKTWFEQWMGTEVLKWTAQKHGSYQFETRDGEGKTVFRANGVFHEWIPNQKITRTFEMENTPFPVQLEFMEFEKLSKGTSQLKIHIVFKSVGYRDQLMSMPFAQGLNMAHQRLQDVASQLK